jgi:hypothetical protein
MALERERVVIERFYRAKTFGRHRSHDLYHLPALLNTTQARRGWREGLSETTR